MGRKADELRDELELVEAERRALQRQNAELLAELDNLKNKASGIVTSAPRPAHEDIDTEPTGPAKPGAIPGYQIRHNEISIGGEMVTIATFEDNHSADLQAIQELHRPPPQPEKVETSLDVVRANNRERASLQDSARLNNALISRVASAMKVDRWDSDGTEILEKCQRWANFVYWITKRQANASGDVANELGTVLTALVAPADLAKWIMSKTADTVPQVVREVAETRSGPSDRTVSREELLWILNTCKAVADTPSRGVLLGANTQNYLNAFSWLDEALETDRGTRELLSLINLVLLPFLTGRGRPTA